MVYRKARAIAGSAAFAFLVAGFAMLLFIALISPASALPSNSRQSGQRAEHVVKQFEVIQSLLRKAPATQGIVKDPAPTEILALGACLQSK